MTTRTRIHHMDSLARAHALSVHHSAPAPARTATGTRTTIYFVYPNIMLNYAEDAETQARIAKDQAFSDEVQMEDISICEAVQKGLSSGFYAQDEISRAARR